jgi:hypothetical protein
MGIDISRKQGATYLNEDQRWLKGGVLYAPADEILLDPDAFGDFDDGQVPAGLALTKDATTGQYGPSAGEGAEAEGRLLTSAKVTPGGAPVAAALAVRCDVITNYLPDGDDEDAAESLVHMRHFTYNHLA